MANRTLPCGTLVTLRYRDRTVRVPVIDRGPFVAGRDYDLTWATKLALGAGDVTVIWASAAERAGARLHSGSASCTGPLGSGGVRASSSKDATRTPSSRTGRGGA